VIDRRGDEDHDDPEAGYVIGPGEGGPDVQLRRARREPLGTRSDEWIAGQIRERIAASSLAASGIEVEVGAGEVRLRGRVSGPAAKRLAEQIAESVAGSRSVRSELGIGPDRGDAPGGRTPRRA
jgi:hypothetical protein